jgi:hypothetical protein
LTGFAIIELLPTMRSLTPDSGSDPAKKDTKKPMRDEYRIRRAADLNGMTPGQGCGMIDL